MKKRVTVYRAMQAAMVAASIAITIWNALREDEPLRILLGPVNLLFLLAPPAAERLFRLKLGDRLKTVVLAFILLAFGLGTAVRGYELIGPLDTIAHLISGILFTLIGMCFYARLRREPIGAKDWAITITYGFFFSMFVAVLWEIYEYTAFLITGHDAQNHLTTGAADTMEDLIACFIGSLLMGLSYILAVKKKVRLFMVRTFEDFAQMNPRN